MDLATHTEHSLDLHVVRTAVVECAATTLGAAALAELSPLEDAAAVRAMYTRMREWITLADAGSAASLGGAHDIRAAAIGAHKGEVLEDHVLVAVSRTLDVLDRAARALLDPDTAELAPSLADIAARIDIDPGLQFDLLSAFEPDGRLSERSFPELGDLRRAIQNLHGTLRSTLDEMARGEELADDLQDTFWTVRNDRYVLPLKPHAKRMGVVHGTSGSGKTVFVEPHQILELNNRLRIAEGQLLAAERRILAALSRAVGAARDGILQSLEALVELDGVQARAELARKLEATDVQVGTEGRVALRSARHPVLVLRGIEVVGQDLALTPERPALVLTGPNTGGKTVALKTLGLCAWMVRHGLPVPADDDSRVDFFDTVVADVGDAQTVTDDLSSFSAQLVAVRGMLERAGPGVLVLLDELASGTDPSQGAALAQAVLEALVDSGARVVTTTHYPPLKALPTADPRFAVAALEVRGGRPSYRLIPDATGESHAIATAERLGLAPDLLVRARALLEQADRGLSRTLEALELERTALDEALRAAELARLEAQQLEAKARRKAEQLQARLEELEAQGARAFQQRLAKADRAIGAVVAQLQAAPSHKAATAARQTLDAFRGLVPSAEPDAVEPAPRQLRVGDRVRHATMGTGTVEAVGRTIRVRGRAVQFTAKPDQLELLDPPRPKPRRTPAPAPAREAPQVDLTSALRIPGNTVDLRGMRVDEALDAVDQGLDSAVARGIEVVFVLHGHGTGALKTAVRRALKGHPVAHRSMPANADQGGDAYTVVAVRA